MAGWLMALSLLLLIVFQAYWLRGTYLDEASRLRRELWLILRETALQRQLQNLPADSSGAIRATRIPTPASVLGFPINIAIKKDSVATAGKARIIMAGEPLPDTLPKRNIRRFFDTERRYTGSGPMVVSTFFPGDTSELKMLDSAYQKELAATGISLRYSMRLAPLSRQNTVYPRDGMIRFNINGRPGMVNMMLADAQFNHIFWYLLPKIGWPIFFSLIMLGITLSAFLFLYRSLLTQHRLAQLKNDFISNLTHELKTPISTVSVAVEALSHFNALQNTERTREYLGISAEALQRLSMLVDQVMHVSRFEQGNIAWNMETLDLKELIARVSQNMKPQLEKSGAVFHLEAASGNWPIRGDRQHLQSVWYNLLDNALKYTSRIPEIKVELTRQGADYRILVSDNGMGIPPEYRNRVFEKFFRVPKGNTHNIKGYGLGLSYVAAVLQSHGGSISLERTSPEGSSFVVLLPVFNG